jgi:hypothetical protein
MLWTHLQSHGIFIEELDRDRGDARSVPSNDEILP